MTLDELIMELDSGSFNSEASAGLRDLVAALNKRAQDGGTAKGEVTVKLKFAALNNGRVEVEASCDIKSPGPRRSKEVRWIDGRGSLAAADPRQSALPLKSPGRKGEVS